MRPRPLQPASSAAWRRSFSRSPEWVILTPIPFGFDESRPIHSRGEVATLHPHFGDEGEVKTGREQPVDARQGAPTENRTHSRNRSPVMGSKGPASRTADRRRGRAPSLGLCAAVRRIRRKSAGQILEKAPIFRPLDAPPFHRRVVRAGPQSGQWSRRRPAALGSRTTAASSEYAAM